VTPKLSGEELERGTTNEQRLPNKEDTQNVTNLNSPSLQPQSYRLFGAYMNSVATYQDGTIAWLSSDSMFSWVTSSVYEKFAGGGYMGGIKLIRGCAESSSSKERDDKTPLPPSDNIPGLDERQQRLLKRRSAPPSTKAEGENSYGEQPEVSATKSTGARLQRQLSSLLESSSKNNDEKEEELRKLEEEEIQDDYNAQAGETQGRDIEHLVLVTHGIGQLLSLR
jgi:hypothetical protein